MDKNSLEYVELRLKELQDEKRSIGSRQNGNYSPKSMSGSIGGESVDVLEDSLDNM